jgi:hypothetical protein
MEGGEFEGIASRRLSAGGKEGLDTSLLPIETRLMQRRVAFMIRCIDPGAVAHQEVHEHEVAPP